jgi:hypothetical protein
MESNFKQRQYDKYVIKTDSEWRTNLKTFELPPWLFSISFIQQMPNGELYETFEL